MSNTTTQIPLATVALPIFLASIAGGYAVGSSDRSNTIQGLESTIKAYDNANKKNFPELLQQLVSASETLSLNAIQQERLVLSNGEIEQLNEKTSNQSKRIAKLNTEQLKYQNTIGTLQVELDKYTANTRKFTVKVGDSHEIIPNEFFIGVTYAGSTSTNVILNNKKETLNIGQSYDFMNKKAKCSIFVTDMDFEYEVGFKLVCKS